MLGDARCGDEGRSEVDSRGGDGLLVVLSVQHLFTSKYYWEELAAVAWMPLAYTMLHKY